MKVFDLRRFGGRLLVLGRALILPTDTSNDGVNVRGSLRFDNSANSVQFFGNGGWRGVGSPYISGEIETGSVLTCEVPVEWTGVTYQWTRDGTNISGATSATYTLVALDADKVITCRVANTGWNVVARGNSSDPVDPIDQPPEGFEFVTTNDGTENVTDEGEPVTTPA